MQTEDTFRRRELANLDIAAEITSDGHTVVATFDRTQFDALVQLASRTPALDDCSECDASYRSGYRDGVASVKADKEEAAS